MPPTGDEDPENQHLRGFSEHSQMSSQSVNLTKKIVIAKKTFLATQKIRHNFENIKIGENYSL